VGLAHVCSYKHAGTSRGPIAFAQVPHVEEPTEDQVTELQEKYLAAMEKLFNDNAEKYGSKSNLIVL
jgi:hypothetical protein